MDKNKDTLNIIKLVILRNSIKIFVVQFYQKGNSLLEREKEFHYRNDIDLQGWRY